MTRQEMLQNMEIDAPAKYTIIGVTKCGEGEIVREFEGLDDAKRAGLKLWASGLVCAVSLHKPRGKSHRLVKDDRCTRSKRGKMRWTN